MANCILCGGSNVRAVKDGVATEINCKTCGHYMADVEELADLRKENPSCIPRIVHRMCRMRDGKTDLVILAPALVNDLIVDPLPSVREQEDSLLLWLGDKLREEDPTGAVSMGDNVDFVAAWVGSFNLNSLFKIIEYLDHEGLLSWMNDGLKNPVRMTPKGWDRYEDIRRAPSQARLAFMAMPFGNNELDHVYKDCFRDAVEKTGFKLRRLDEWQGAGLIDDQLRVRIRSARFIVAELTTENRGVYWEAGFAEGLGRDVIYTCKRSEQPNLNTHFDTNHHLTVQWEPGKLEDAAEKLKAAIRATLPTEATQSDD
jgi:hypothetical protein